MNWSKNEVTGSVRRGVRRNLGVGLLDKPRGPYDVFHKEFNAKPSSAPCPNGMAKDLEVEVTKVTVFGPFGWESMTTGCLASCGWP